MSRSDSLQTTLGNDRRLRAAPNVIGRILGQSAVVIHLSTNKIYELNDTGARIWGLLVTGATRDELVNVLEQEFSGEREEVSDAVDQLLLVLHAEGLI